MRNNALYGNERMARVALPNGIPRAPCKNAERSDASCYYIYTFTISLGIGPFLKELMKNI